MQKFKLSCQTRARMRSQLPPLFLLSDVHKRLPLLQLIQGTWERLRVLLGPIYTKRQHQHCDNSGMTLVILFSFKTVEHCCNVDADAQCKRTLSTNFNKKWNENYAM